MLDDLEYYASMVLVGLVVAGVPALILWLNYKFITG